MPPQVAGSNPDGEPEAREGPSMELLRRKVVQRPRGPTADAASKCDR